MSTALSPGLDGLFLVPPEHREPDTEFATATQILGCDDDALTEFVRCGLPIDENGRFDSHDLFNLGLHYGTGRSVPKQAFAFSLRWMRETTEALLAPRALTFELRLACAAAACGTNPVSILARPRSERYGGAVLDLAPQGAGDLLTRPAAELALTATVHTRGELTPLRSPELREVVREFAGLGLRWVKLPDALRGDENLLTSHRVASCESASRYLARRCTEAGIAAVTRIGWVAGMLDLVHAWVEVEDVDGATKVIDPIFALFATTIPAANPLLADPGMSVRTNRLIPCGLAVGGHVAEHSCGTGLAPVRLSTKIVPLKERS